MIERSKIIIRYVVLILMTAVLIQCQQAPGDQWAEDFKYQPVSGRPALEVNYTDASRSAFQVLAEDYKVTGQLTTPHLLSDDQNTPWLWLEVEDEQGIVYSTKLSGGSSRINLYRRGPYFCEVHWFDMQPTSDQDEVAPLNGDLTLYCYPEKMLAEVSWHATDDFKARRMVVRGIAPIDFECTTFSKGSKQTFHFPLFGEEEPLSNEAFTLIEGEVPLHYNARKGYYEIGTNTTYSFQKQLYDFPNRYETATFSLHNDDRARKIYIGHKSVKGGAIVEGGAVLDRDGQTLPIVVQVSKNFDGEKEEKFYNPGDTAFSETFFPLYLEPGEKMILSSLHLYQNWGRHMTKHWSSLGAWMDYFHSSTGVTETTCYVPFKFAGIGGVAIADFRAMSQETFWSGQPQHDNLAGHSFLSFYDGEHWQHSKYESTIYRSTGPNWYDIQMNYTSADESVKITADIWEAPQLDELRSFFKVRYEVLKPLVIEDAQAHFRLLTITSTIQQHRFTRMAATGLNDREIDFSRGPFPVKGHPLPAKNAFLAMFGDHTKPAWGSNAIVIREFKGPEGIGPAATLQTGPYLDRFHDVMMQTHRFNDHEKDTRLFLAPDVEKLELQPGDVFEIDGYWLPYGPVEDAETPRRETVTYAAEVPRVTSCVKGTSLSDLPIRIRAENNQAEFSIVGGKDLLPVIVTGLTDWRYPRIWKKEGDRWHLLSHARNTDHDGYQVFSEEGGTFGAVFLVHSDEVEQTLKVSVGKPVEEGTKIELQVSANGAIPADVGLLDSKGTVAIRLSYPNTGPGGKEKSISHTQWRTSEGNSIWFESSEGNWLRGGRISPNQDDLDLEYWWQNREDGIVHAPPEFHLELAGTPFEDPDGLRTWVLITDGWIKAEGTMRLEEPGRAAIAVQSSKGGQILCMAWPKVHSVINKPGQGIGISLEPINFSLRKRYHVRGKVYLVDADLEALRDRINKEITVR